MRIAFDITENELLAFLSESTNRTRSFRTAVLPGVPVAVLLGALGLAIVRPNFLLGVFLFITWVILFAIAWYIEWPRRVETSSRATVKTGTLNNELGPHVVELLPEGIRETGRAGETLRRWSFIGGAWLSPTHLFVEVANSGPSIVIPRKAFASDDEAAQFVEAVKEKCGAAQQADAADEAQGGTRTAS